MPAQIREFTDKDMPTLIRLLNERYKNSYEFTPYTKERLNEWLESRKFEILFAIKDDEVFGCVAYNDGHWGEEVEWLAAQESPERKKIENELVKEAEKYVKGSTVFTAIDADSPRTNDWIERGYKQEGGLYHMVARLNGVKPIPEVPDNIILRSMKPEEEKELVEAVNAGFGSQRIQAGIIQEWKAKFPPFDENWIHIAESNSKIVSVVASRTDLNYNSVFNGKRGYLGPATTLPEFRGKNLASALTRRAMNFLFENGLNSVALYTSEQNAPSVALLIRLGFEVGHNWKFMRKYFKR